MILLLSPKTSEYLISHLLHFDLFLGGLGGGRSLIVCECIFMLTKRLYWHLVTHFCYTSVLYILVDFIFDPMPSIYFKNGSTETE